jgi:carbon-monoxide dehydrogenase iron sulfur subunit
MDEVFVDVRRCTGCRSCEIACAVEHSASKNLYGAVFEQPRSQKRIHVESARVYAYPVRCVHCSDPACVAACPNGAMSRDAASGAVSVNADRCQGCFMCAMVCPFGAISAHPTAKVAVKCDFCPDRRAKGLQPACVSACPTKALRYGDEADLAKTKRTEVAERVAKTVTDNVDEPDSSPMGVLRTLGGR